MFNISDPLHPQEIAYFVAPPKHEPENARRRQQLRDVEAGVRPGAQGDLVHGRQQRLLRPQARQPVLAEPAAPRDGQAAPTREAPAPTALRLGALVLGQAVHQRDRLAQDRPLVRAEVGRDRRRQPALAPLAVLAQRDVAGLGQLDERAAAVVGVGPAGDEAVRPRARRPSGPSTAAARARRRRGR